MKKRKKFKEPAEEIQKEKIIGAQYSNASGVFTLVEGRLYDNEGQRTSAVAVTNNNDPLIRDKVQE